MANSGNVASIIQVAAMVTAALQVRSTETATSSHCFGIGLLSVRAFSPQYN